MTTKAQRMTVGLALLDDEMLALSIGINETRAISRS